MTGFVMPHEFAGSRFVRRLGAAGGSLDARACRSLVLRYARLYQDVYSFAALERVFALLAGVDGEPGRLGAALEGARAEVQEAMEEYFISLNEVAAVMHRLLDGAPMGVGDVLECVGRVWSAHACNESPEEFAEREDAVLCGLLDGLLDRLDPRSSAGG